MASINEAVIQQQLDQLEDPVQRKITQIIVEKWDATGMLDGLKGRTKRNIAVLYENQLREIKRQNMLNETSQTSAAAGFEAWSNVAMPLVRKVFANLLANEIVSVQPMNLPSGLVFYLDFTFGTTSTTDKDVRTAGSSLYGNTSSSGQPAGGYYGGVSFSYTRNFLSGTLGSFASAATYTAGTTNVITTASYQDIDYDPSLSASFAASALGYKKIVVPVASMSTVDVTQLKAITLTGTNINTHYRTFTKHLPAISSIAFIVSASDFVADYAVTGSWLKANTQDSRGDFEIGQTGVGTNPIPQLNIRVTSATVVAGSRKLKAEWTPELQQDLAAYQDIDAEAELTTMLGDQVGLEIDREILMKLVENGEKTNLYYWSRNIGTYVDTSTGATVGAGTFYGTQQEWYQTLVETLLFASNMIHKKTLRGGANFIVTSAEVSSMLESTITFHPNLSLDEKEVKYSLGIEKVGTLSGKWVLYKDPLFPTNKILLGYRGSSFLENGFIYSPYIPLTLTPTVLDPTNFQPRKGIMSRYATTTVRPEFYSVVIVRDMRTGV